MPDSERVLTMADPTDDLVDACGPEDWHPSGTWVPEFEDELKPEAYDGN